MTIEHLAAQNSPTGPQLPAEVVGELGNLILIPDKLNVDLGNKPFQKKMEILQNAGVPLDPELKHAKKWTQDEIRARSKYLAKLGHETIFKV